MSCFSVLQFIVGVTIGALITLSFTSHHDWSTEQLLSWIFEHPLPYIQPRHAKISAIDTNSNLSSSPGIVSSTLETLASHLNQKKVPQVSSTPKLPPVSRWTPGEVGWIETFRQKALDATNEFIPAPQVISKPQAPPPVGAPSTSKDVSPSLQSDTPPAMPTITTTATEVMPSLKTTHAIQNQNLPLRGELLVATDPGSDPASPDENPFMKTGIRKKKDRANALNRKKKQNLDTFASATANSQSASFVPSTELDLFYINTGDRFTSAEGSPPVDQLLSSGQVVPYPPLLPYHSQALREPVRPPYIPSLPSVTALRTHPLYDHLLPLISPLPNMTLQKASHEQENLKLHLCNAVFEAYSASYLTTKEHILAVKSERYNLSWVNCEMASFTHMRDSPLFYDHPRAQGMVMQTLDVLDFSAIHLSAFERSSKKYKHILWPSREDQKTKWTHIDAIREAGKQLENLINPLKSGRNITWTEESKRTVVIMPFLGGAMGAGHSELGNRFIYLKTCFWSLYEFFPNIVAGVSRQEDVDWAWKESGLPFYDIMRIDGLPKSAGLPLSTVRHTKAKLASGEWPFDYVFFTESDQILISRQLPMLHDHLKRYPRRMLLPHRLMPYSDRVIKEIHKRSVDPVPNKWMNQSCCLPRQNCQERKTWLSISNPNLPVMNYYGLYVPLGNNNFLNEEYRGCKLTDYIPDYCPG